MRDCIGGTWLRQLTAQSCPSLPPPPQQPHAPGWTPPAIVPYGPISLEPSAMCLHYGVEAFEGMKAYKDARGRLRLFRPDMNMDRLRRSAARLTLPDFDGAAFLACIKALVRQERDWVPAHRGYSLYLRPTILGTQTTLGVGPSNRALLLCIASPVGPYYKTGFAAVSLYASQRYVRAWPGGTGDCKVGGNYAPGILPQIQAAAKGYSQILWLFGPQDNVTEVGTMNLFCFWRNERGERELLTPPLDGTILPGVTRDSILRLARSWGEFAVVERPLTMPELVRALKAERVVEMFGAGWVWHDERGFWCSFCRSPVFACLHYHQHPRGTQHRGNRVPNQKHPLRGHGPRHSPGRQGRHCSGWALDTPSRRHYHGHSVRRDPTRVVRGH